MTTTLTRTPFSRYTPHRFVEYFIDQHTGDDPAWVVDQVMRILKGTQVHASKGQDGIWRIRTGDPSIQYLQYVCEIKNDGYHYNQGNPPCR